MYVQQNTTTCETYEGPEMFKSTNHAVKVECVCMRIYIKTSLAIQSHSPSPSYHAESKTKHGKWERGMDLAGQTILNLTSTGISWS